MIKKNVFFAKYLNKEKQSQNSIGQTILNFNAYFVSHIFLLKNGIFGFQYLK